MQEETQGQPSAADLDQVAAEQSAAEATQNEVPDAKTDPNANSAPAPIDIATGNAQIGKVTTDPETGEQKQEIHLEFPLGDIVRKIVQEELGKLVEHIKGQEQEGPNLHDVHHRLKTLEEELEAAGLRARKEVVEVASEVGNQAGEAIGEAMDQR